MAINERLIHTAADAAGGGTGNQEEGLILHLDANDVDSYDGDGTVWYDIKDHEYTPATNVDEHFNTIIWNGDGASSRSFTDVGFQPDLVWVKARSAQNHTLYDSVRGVGKYLASEGSLAESTDATYGQLTSFDVDGFTATKGTDATYSFFNSSNSYYNSGYVAWCFKAGGAAVSNTNGDITSQVSVNNDLGFSIVSYTGNSSFGQTVGHGLDVQPQMVIHKNLSNARNWRTYVEPLGATKYINLDETAAAGTYGSFNNTAPTSTVFSTTNSVADRATNFNGDNYIAYCFTSKRGVSKVGSYTGNGSTTGPIVYLGFEPAFLMFKCSSQVGNWIVIDNKRATSNPRTPHLRANSNSADDSGTNEYVDFLGNGFQPKGVSNYNNNSSGQTYIYYAVAKNTKETSLIPDTDLELHLDPASYSGSGTTWTADTGSNATVVASRYDQELGDSFDISLDSESTIVIPSGHPLNGSSFTLEFWFRSTEDWNNSGKGHYFIYEGAAAGWNFFYYEGLGWRISAPVSTGYFGNNTVVTNKWHHVSLTYTGGVTKFYLDGELLKTHSATRNSSSLSAFDFGSTEAAAYKPKCLVGQIRMYSTALSQDQVRQNYNFTKNDYPNGNDGTISGASWNPGGYFDFDGINDYIDLSNNTSFPTTNSQTNNVKAISAWIKPDTTSSNVYIFSVSSTTETKDYFTFDWIQSIWSGVPDLRLRVQNGGSGNRLDALVGVTATDQWVHVVAQLTTEVELYINGVKKTVTYTKTGNATDSWWIGNISYATAVDYLIGQYRTTTSGSNASNSDGRMSKLKVYNKALTQAEITALYNEGE